MNSIAHLDKAFYPSSVAVIGVGPITAGRFYVESLLGAGFHGKIYPVHPNGGEIAGLAIYRNLNEIPKPVDYVICCIPARHVPKMISEAAAKGVKTVSLFTSGFSETGRDEGRKLEAEIVRLAGKGDMRLIGPNCMGIYSPRVGLSFADDLPREVGRVAFVCQSGGNAIYFVRLGAERGIRFSKVISYGNACDVDECDLFEYLRDDPETDLVAAYIEGVKDGSRFRKVLSSLSDVKPVIILKGGMTAEGARTASSHTASLAGSQDTWRALLVQHNAIMADTLTEMLDLVVTFRFLAPPRGRRVAMIGGGGGASVLATDACAANGFTLPGIPSAVSAKIKGSLDSEAGLILSNPIELNMYPQATLKITRALLSMGSVDLMLANCVFGQEPWDFFDAWFDIFCDTVLKVHKETTKPIGVVLLSELDNKQKHFAALRRKYGEAGLPVYYSMSGACRAIDRFMRYQKMRRNSIDRDSAKAGS
jgi:acyl-CoA synthetase (NDP forming)